MGLSISVGHLAWCIAEGEDEQLESVRDDVREINRVLAANDLPPHVEPEALPPFHNRSRGAGLPYTMIHYLRRAVAYARHAPDKFTPSTGDPTEDPLVEDELCVHMDSHLICHSDGDGFYVPIDFPEPLYDDAEPGIGTLGSSHAAMRELVLVALLLGIRLDGNELPDAVADEINAERDGPLRAERYVWLKLFERFRQSIEQKAAVWFH